jgi:nucleotide-binding universal stress UspA family protein
MIEIANVLVGTDFGEASESALTYGRELARTFGARLHVFHCVENPLMWAGPESAGVNLAQLQVDLEANAQAQMDQLVMAEDRAQLKAVAVLRTGNSPAFEIVRYAREAAIDIVVMGTHGRGRVAHLLMGNVAEKVVRLAPCPVLTVRHPEHEFIMPDALQVVEKARR